MSISLSVATVIEKNRLASATPFLICLDVGVIDPATGALVETLYIVRNNENIVFDGKTYTATYFDLELAAEANAQHSITLAIKDYTLALSARMQQYGGGVGFTVRLAVVNAGNLTQPPEILEFFEAIGASAADYVCSFTLGAENSIMQSFPRRRQLRDFCSWRYKSEQCGYSGWMPDCDLSLQGPNGCAAHGNTPRFGGFPGITPVGAARG